MQQQNSYIIGEVDDYTNFADVTSKNLPLSFQETLQADAAFSTVASAHDYLWSCVAEIEQNPAEMVDLSLALFANFRVNGSINLLTDYWSALPA